MERAEIIPGFSSPILQVVLDLDSDKLVDFVYKIKKKDSIGKIHSNKGGWQSNDILETESSAEFVKLPTVLLPHTIELVVSSPVYGLLLSDK